jgi:hypothetical protein
LIVDKDSRAEAVKQLREKGLELHSKLQEVGDGFQRARHDPIPEVPWVSLETMHNELEAFRQQVKVWREASKVTDLGKLPQSDDDLKIAKEGVVTLNQLHAFLEDYHAYIHGGVHYMQQAVTIFEALRPYGTSSDEQTLEDLKQIYHDSRDLLGDQRALLADDRRRPLKGKIEQFRQRYQPLYYKLHECIVGEKAPWDELQALRQSARYQSLNQLKTLPFFSSAELDTIGLDMQQLQRQQCLPFNAETVEREAVCPYCQFPTVPVTDLENAMSDFNERLAKLWQKWEEQTLAEIDRLLDETVGGQRRAELITSDARQRLEKILLHKALPELVTSELVQNLYDLAADLEAVTFNLHAFAQRLLADRSVLTVAELEQAWKGHLGDLLRGHEREQVRIQVEYGETPQTNE